jgi:hypothetical protein
MAAARRKKEKMFPLLLAFPLILAAASGDNPKYAPPAVAAAEARLDRAGSVIGAASACPEIERDRVSAALRKMRALIEQGVDNNNQYYAAHRIFDKALDKGKAAIRNRESDCGRAEADLSGLEKELGP